MAFRNNATVVLVHGAWADGSSWETVINSLSEAGLGVICAPLPLTTLSDDAAAVKRAIAHVDGPVILVAHAYAGAVIASVDDEKVNGLVYITALAPDEGETTAEVFYRETPHPDAPKLGPDNAGYIWMPHEGIQRAFAPNAKPTWYLIAEEDRMIPEKTQRFMAERMKATIRTANADHTPSLTMPKPVVEIVLEAAHATLTG